MANRADACIRLRPVCATGGFFQLVIGYCENEKFFFFGWVEGAINSAGMNVHRNGSCPQRRPVLPGAAVNTTRTHAWRTSLGGGHEVFALSPGNLRGHSLHRTTRRGGAKLSVVLTRRHSAATRHWNNAWPTGWGKAGPVRPVHTHPRRAPGKRRSRLVSDIRGRPPCGLRHSS